jgi:hypothetical protein
MRGTSPVCLEFTILTAARTGEVLGMQWSEVDWDKRTWTMHTVPLTERAMEILKQQRQYANESGFVFVGYNREKLTDRCLRSVLHYRGWTAPFMAFEARSVIGVAIKQVFSVSTSKSAWPIRSATVWSAPTGDRMHWKSAGRFWTRGQRIAGELPP